MRRSDSPAHHNVHPRYTNKTSVYRGPDTCVNPVSKVTRREMRGSERNPSRSRSEENRKQRKRFSSSSEEPDSDDNEKSNDDHSTTRPSNTPPSPRTTLITKSTSTFPSTTTINRSGRTTGAAINSTTRRPRSAPTFAPQSGNSSSNRVTITVLAVVSGLVFFIVILLALCLAWRKWCQSRPPADVTPRDKSTYHMYSEIDHTTMILDEDTRGPPNQRLTTANDRVIPSAPLYQDMPDNLVNDNTYNVLHEKEQVKPNDTYSGLDPRFVDLNDPRLNTYDVTSDIIGKSVSAENTSGSFEPDLKIVSEATVPQDGKSSGLTSDNIDNTTNNSVGTDPSGNSGQYFVLEKVPAVTESQNKIVHEIPIDSGPDNYFKLEPLA